MTGASEASFLSVVCEVKWTGPSAKFSQVQGRSSSHMQQHKHNIDDSNLK